MLRIVRTYPRNEQLMAQHAVKKLLADAWNPYWPKFGAGLVHFPGVCDTCGKHFWRPDNSAVDTCEACMQLKAYRDQLHQEESETRLRRMRESDTVEKLWYND